MRGGSDRLARGLVGMGSVDDPTADPRPALRTLADALGLG